MANLTPFCQNFHEHDHDDDDDDDDDDEDDDDDDDDDLAAPAPIWHDSGQTLVERVTLHLIVKIITQSTLINIFVIIIIIIVVVSPWSNKETTLKISLHFP